MVELSRGKNNAVSVVVVGSSCNLCRSLVCNSFGALCSASAIVSPSTALCLIEREDLQKNRANAAGNAQINGVL